MVIVARLNDDLVGARDVSSAEESLSAIDSLLSSFDKDQRSRDDELNQRLKKQAEEVERFKIQIASNSANKRRREEIESQRKALDAKKALEKKANEALLAAQRKLSKATTAEQRALIREEIKEKKKLYKAAAEEVAKYERDIAQETEDFKKAVAEQTDRVIAAYHTNILKNGTHEEKARIHELEADRLAESQETTRKEYLDRLTALELRKADAQKALDEQKAAEIQAAKAAGEDTAKIEAEYAARRKKQDEEIAAEKAAADKDYADKAEQINKKLQDAKLAEAVETRRQELENNVQALEEERAVAIAMGDSLALAAVSLEDFTSHPSLKNGFKIAHEFSKQGLDGMKKLVEEQKKVYSAKSADAASKRNEARNAKKAVEEAEANGASEDELKELLEKQHQAELEANKATSEANAAAVSVAVGAMATAIGESMNKAMDEAEGMLKDYTGVINSRLQGSGESFTGGLLGGGILDKVTSLLTTNPFIQSKDMLKSVKQLAESGVSYNLEQRAFLGTISEKIASTFDAFDSNLARLIRLQQADTTAARLGMEAALTKFLNSKYQDSSYLNKGGLADSVAASLIDAQATMNRDQGAAFEFTVQKWLGSLSSVGLSDAAATKIAEGLNYVATGNVSALAGNESLQTLIAMSAAEAGLEYSELLLNGLDADSTNKLLKSMVSYLKQIAEGADNQVVRSAYGDVFSMSMSDFKAVSNLTSGDISDIASTTLAYDQMISELNSQLSVSNLMSRSHMGEMLGNLYDNAVFGVATDMMANPVTYAMQKMLNFMEEQMIDIAIPFINVYGFGLDLNATVTDLMRMGLGLAQGFSLATNILGGLASGGGTDLSFWGGTEYTKRGEGMTFNTASAVGETSGSMQYTGSGNADDQKNSTMNSATDSAEEDKEVVNKNSDPGFTTDDFYKAVVEGEENNGIVRTRDYNIQLASDKSGGFIWTRDSRFMFDSNGALVVTDVRALAALGLIARGLGIAGTDVSRVFSYSSLSLGLETTSTDKVHVTKVGKPVSVNRTSMEFNSENAETFLSAFSAEEDSTHYIKVSINDIANELQNSLPVSIKELHSELAAVPVTISGGSGLDGMAKEQTLKTLISLFSGSNDGKAHVRIQNEDGSRLQVDTEQLQLTSDTALEPADTFFMGYTEVGTYDNNKGIQW